MSTTHLGILQDTSKDQHSNGRCITELIGRFWQHQLLLSFSEVRMLLLSCLRAEGCRFGKRGSPTEKLNAPARQEDPVFDLVLPSLASEHQRFGGSRVIDPLQLVAARQPPVPVAVQFQSLAVIRRLAPVHTRCPASPTSNSGRVRPRGCGLCLLRFGIRFRGGVLRRQRKAPGGQRAQQK